MIACRAFNKKHMTLSRRSCVFHFQSGLARTSVDTWESTLQGAEGLYPSASATEGIQLVNAFVYPSTRFRAMARRLRRGGISEVAAGVVAQLHATVRPSNEETVRGKFARSIVSRKV